MTRVAPGSVHRTRTGRNLSIRCRTQHQVHSMHLASAIPTEIKPRRAGLPFAKGRKRRLPQTIYLIIPSERLRNWQTEFDVPDFQSTFWQISATTSIPWHVSGLVIEAMHVRVAVGRLRHLPFHLPPFRSNGIQWFVQPRGCK
jgi:hypothetical protein